MGANPYSWNAQCAEVWDRFIQTTVLNFGTACIPRYASVLGASQGIGRLHSWAC